MACAAAQSDQGHHFHIDCIESTVKRRRRKKKKILKTGTPKIIYCNYLKMEEVGFDNVVMFPKDGDGMANSVDPDQTAPRAV